MQWAGCILGIAGAALILRDGAAAAAAGVVRETFIFIFMPL